MEHRIAGDLKAKKVKRLSVDEERMCLTIGDQVWQLPSATDSQRLIERIEVMKQLQDKYDLKRNGFFLLQVSRKERYDRFVPLASWNHPLQGGPQAEDRLDKLAARAYSIRPDEDPECMADNPVKRWTGLDNTLFALLDEVDDLFLVLYVAEGRQTSFGAELLQDLLASIEKRGLRAECMVAERNGLHEVMQDVFDEVLDKYGGARDFLATVELRSEQVVASSALTGEVVAQLERNPGPITLGQIREAIASARDCPRGAVKLVSSAGAALADDDGEVFSAAR